MNINVLCYIQRCINILIVLNSHIGEMLLSYVIIFNISQSLGKLEMYF